MSTDSVFLSGDKRSNPSNYAMVTISEGATMTGGELHLSGEEDAYGHRKLGGIGAVTGQLIGQITGVGIVLQQVAYLMRSGTPDSLDLMVATNFAVMAADLVLEGARGAWWLSERQHTAVPISATREGVRGWTWTSCTTSRYRPKVRHGASRCSCIEFSVVRRPHRGRRLSGLNAVIRAVVSRAIGTHGMEVVGIRTGGRADGGHVRRSTGRRPWDLQRGGTILGTSRRDRTSMATATRAFADDRGRDRRGDRDRRRRHAAHCTHARRGCR
jgi:6-phosphofructokinase